MAALKYKVELNESERTHLKEIASRGETSARKVKRALVLLMYDPIRRLRRHACKVKVSELVLSSRRRFDRP